MNLKETILEITDLFPHKHKLFIKTLKNNMTEIEKLGTEFTRQREEAAFDTLMRRVSDYLNVFPYESWMGDIRLIIRDSYDAFREEGKISLSPALKVWPLHWKSYENPNKAEGKIYMGEAGLFRAEIYFTGGGYEGFIRPDNSFSYVNLVITEAPDIENCVLQLRKQFHKMLLEFAEEIESMPRGIIKREESV